MLWDLKKKTIEFSHDVVRIKERIIAQWSKEQKSINFIYINYYANAIIVHAEYFG